MYKKIEKIKREISEIPLTIFRPVESKNLPTIVHYHGWGSTVENYELFGEIYALYGYQAILPELDGHGSRGELDYDTYKDALPTIIKTVEEYMSIEKDLKESYDIDELILSGHSLGGMIASILVNEDRDINTFIMYNSIYNFDFVIKNINEESLEKINQMDSRLIDAASDIAEKVDLKRLDQIDSLFMTGSLDNVIDPNITKATEVELKKANIFKAQFLYYEDLGHAIGYKMIRDSLRFLGRRFL